MRTQTTSENLKDGVAVERADLNVTDAGSAVIAKAVGSTNIALSSTGVDAGTGDVTFDLSTTGVGAGTYTKYQVDIYGRIISASNLVAGDLPSGSGFYIQNQNASPQATTNLWISGVASATEHRSYNGAGTFYVSVTAPAGIAANYTFALPASYGSNGNVLTGNGSGGLSWTDLTTVYVPIAGTSTITGAKTFSAGISTSSLAVTGTTTLATSLNGLLKATSGVVSAAGASDVTGQLLTGFTVGSNTAIVAGDTILAAFGKTQAQINAMTNFWARASTTVSLATSTDTVNLGSPTLTNGKLNIGGGSAGGSIVNSLSTGYRLLLHFDGNNGSRKILDSGTYSTPIYTRGTQYYNPPVISTTQSKFGNTSLRLDGTNYIEAASRLSIGTGDFSFDFHVFFTNVSGTQTLFDWGGTASGIVLAYSAGTWTCTVAGTACTFSNTPSVNTWYHIAVSRTSNSVRFWVAGAKTGTTQTASGSVTGTNTANMFIGATAAGANRASIYMDEFRSVTGSSVYTSDAAITVPTTAYEPGGLRLSAGGANYTPDNYVMSCDGAGSFMPQRPPRLQMVTFCLGENVANTTKYFYSNRALGSTQDDAQRSGNSSGMSFGTACSPIFAGFNGRIVSATLVVQGVGVNNGSVTYPVVYRADFFRVGFSAEHDPNINGGSAVQLNFNLVSGTTIGIYSVGATNTRVELQDLNIPIFAGDPMALKFINGSGASGAAMTQMAFVTLVIEETF